MNVNKPLLRRSSLSLSSAVQPFRKNKLTMTNSHGNNEAAAANVADSVADGDKNTAFDELRAYVKQGGEFSKEIVATLQERAQLEATYAKGLSKLSAKLFKASKDAAVPVPTTVSNAWHFIAEDMEEASEVHRNMASVLDENLVRPLKAFAENHYRTRKALESSVDKKAKVLHEWRGAETKTKSKTYANTKANERVQDALLDCKLGRGSRSLSERELVKLEGKRKKSVEAVRKSDLDYYSACIKAERARLDWESAVMKGCSTFRCMEDDRLCQLQNLAEQYYQIMSTSLPKLVSSNSRLAEPIRLCDIGRDMDSVKKQIRVDIDSLGEQILPSFYAEDRTNCMNQERRREALARGLRMVRADIEREKKGKAGVENLARALQETPKFGSEDSQSDVREKLRHMKSMLTYFEASRFKVTNSLYEVDGRPCVSHPLGMYVQFSLKDKNGLAKSVLRIPYNRRQELPPSCLNSPDNDEVLDYHKATDEDDEQDEPINVALFDYRRGRGDGLDFTTTVVTDGEPRGRGDGGQGNVAGCSPDQGGNSPDSDFDSCDGSVDIVTAATTRPNYYKQDSSGNVSQVGASKKLETPQQDSKKESTNSFNSTSSSGFASSSGSCGPESSCGEAPTAAVAATNSNQTENEIEEVCYTATTTTLTKDFRDVSPGLGRCRVLYDYAANLYDELSIKVGDIINIHDKQADGWWLGELRGQVGIFPATYVEEEESQA